MKIVNCPKGGRVPDGYCRASCLNYPGKTRIDNHVLARRPKDTLLTRLYVLVDFLKRISGLKWLLGRLRF